jgi:hypothetical protein
MPKNERTQNGRSTVRVLHFPAASLPTPASTTDVDTDALADSIRKSWTQKSASGKSPSVLKPKLLRLADNKF